MNQNSNDRLNRNRKHNPKTQHHTIGVTLALQDNSNPSMVIPQKRFFLFRIALDIQSLLWLVEYEF